jgi:hypothetical protein
MKAYIVRSTPIIHIASESTIDPRASYVSLVWRGLSSPSDMYDVQRALDLVALDLYGALRSSSKQAVEWQIAPLISLCKEATDRRLRRIDSLRASVILTMVAYAVFLVSGAAYLLLKR